ncbi:uncharacterized protein [Solanum tuberosum]|uniref:uncharacterized protein n=1 Tax=Solanum tuberosum TaxID=4113 RepID=UPI00073A116F|nr:PREDICTED: uncharacterized protein LOC107057858 [Solanum tuberosum]
MTKVIQLAPQNQVHNILSTQIQLQQGQSDQAVWNLNTNGNFSVSFAWNNIREKREKTKINTYTWKRNIPFKCSFLLWRAIRGKLPTNEKLSSFGIEPGDCYCYHSPGNDTIEHIFNSESFAKSVWKFFVVSLGIQTDYLPLRNMIMRCAKKYGGKQSNIARVKHLVILDNFKLLHTIFPYISWPLGWNKLSTLIEKCNHDIKVTTVQWIKPPDRCRGVLRNHIGETIFAFSAPLGEGTNNQVEVEAAIFGLTWCVNLKYNNVILEVDSQLLVDWLVSSTAVPWTISHQMQKLHQLVKQFTHFKCIHTLREANFVANLLSKHIHQITSPQVYFNSQQLPKLAAAYLQHDLADMASFRRGKLKRIKEPP